MTHVHKCSQNELSLLLFVPCSITSCLLLTFGLSPCWKILAFLPLFVLRPAFASGIVHKIAFSQRFMPSIGNVVFMILFAAFLNAAFFAIYELQFHARKTVS